MNLRDRFEWDLANVKTKAPEEFSRQLAAEMSLGGEFVPMIAHAIREQVYRLKRQLVEDVRPSFFLFVLESFALIHLFFFFAI